MLKLFVILEVVTRESKFQAHVSCVDPRASLRTTFVRSAREIREPFARRKVSGVSREQHSPYSKIVACCMEAANSSSRADNWSRSNPG